MKFNLVTVDKTQSLTAFIDGEMYTATNEHPNWKAIVAKLVEEDDSVVDLFDVSKVVARHFDSVSERVSVHDGRVYFDGVEVDNSLTQMIIRFMDEGVEDWIPLVHFFEKVEMNPNSHSREQLYTWLVNKNITIDEEGNLIAYKGVNVNADGDYVSVNSGTAIVNGEEITGKIPNKIGSVIEMPRNEVQHNPSIGCHTGLHAGNWNYASSFATVVLTVSINPRDVVSVPTDCNAQKIRVCRYTVTGIAKNEMKSAVVSGYDSYYDEDDEDY